MGWPPPEKGTLDKRTVIVEPKALCLHCQCQFTLEEGVRCGMRCPDCGAELEVGSGEWASKALAGGNGGQPARADRGGPIQVAELWLPAHNEIDAVAVGQFMSSLPNPVSLEYLGSGGRRVLLVRAPQAALRYLAGKVVTAWPNAHLRILEADPLEMHAPGASHRYELSFVLGEAPYLPLRTWTSFYHGDPVHTLLAATLGLRREERVWLQIFVGGKGRPEWLEAVQRRLKIESQRGFLASEDALSAIGTAVIAQAPLMTGISLARGGLFLALALAGLVAVLLGVRGARLPFALLSLLVIAGGGLLWRALSRDDDPWRGADLALVRQKVVRQDAFFRVAIRASLRAASQERAWTLLSHLENAMSQYALVGGNRFVLAEDPLEGQGAWPAGPAGDGNWIWLGPDELAGLWHPPVVDEQVSPGLVPVHGVEVRAPDPRDVQGFHRIGEYFRPDGGMGPVHANGTMLRRNALLVGKPGTGKTTLMMHLALAGMQDPERPALVIVDPHADLANSLYGAIDPAHAGRIVIMDVGDEAYTLTFNPLNTHRAGWDVGAVTNAIVDIGQALWAEFWGPRQQNPLKRGVQLLAAANALRMPDDLLGLSLLASLLNADHDLRRSFIEAELEGSPYHFQISHWFNKHYRSLSRHMRETIIQSALYKAYRFEEEPMLQLFSCPRSVLDVGQIVQDRKVLVVNTRLSHHGAELSNFVGSLMINVVLREIARQGEVEPGSRVPVMVVVDEFQTFTGVGWPDLIAQMRKFGGRFVLGTQNLASLREKRDQDLRGAILSGVSSLFAFLMNGEDAHYLTRFELSRGKGGPGADSLTSLEPFRAYARLVRQDGTITRPFYFRIEPPAAFDEQLAGRVWESRSAYSLPYETALAEAREQFRYLERYGAALLSRGAGGPGARKPVRTSASAQAAGVLLRSEAAEGRPGTSIGEAIPGPWGAGREAEERPDRGGEGGGAQALLHPEADPFGELEDLFADDLEAGEEGPSEGSGGSPA